MNQCCFEDTLEALGARHSFASPASHCTLQGSSFAVNPTQWRKHNACMCGWCRPIAKCTRFNLIWSNRPVYAHAAASSCDAHVLGSDRGVTFWRPQAPNGYAVLGDCITAGSTQPTFQVCLALLGHSSCALMHR